MKNILSVENMKKSDKGTIAGGVPGIELMRRAAKGVFDAVSWRAPVAVVCGAGNNAGDGYALALLLTGAGIECAVFTLSDRFSADGRYYHDKCISEGVSVRPWNKDDLKGYGTVVDCVFGIGFKGTLNGAEREAVRAINESGAYVVSVDINSGLDADSGLAEYCVISDLTVSVGGFKTGHFLNFAKDAMKEKVNVDIGIEPIDRAYRLLEKEDLFSVFSPRPNCSHKGTYGYAALIGGSRRYTGAIRLSYLSNAAMRSGAGVVRCAFPGSLYHEIVPAFLESTAFPLSDDGGEVRFAESEAEELVAGVKTVAFGMGIGTGEGAKELLTWLLAHFKGVLIVDADGLNILSRLCGKTIKNAACRLILTPHVGEFSRLSSKTSDEILSSPVGCAEDYARAVGAVVLLKGPSTVVTDGETTYIVDAGCAGMATAGSGDVLSGVLAAVASYVPDAAFAAAVAAYVNGKAGERAEEKVGSVSMIASDTVRAIPEVISSIEKNL